MKILKIKNKKPDKKIIKLAAEILKKGGLVIYPTDTAYGLGGNALDPEVIKKVYDIKERDFSKPTHVIVRNWKMIEKLAETSPSTKKFYDKFLPGPLTIILTKQKVIPDILTAGLPTVGVRIPKNNITIQLSSHLSFPYTTPSANKSGGKNPYSIADVKNELVINKVDLILDAGKLPQVKPSTIIDLTTSPPKFLREGPITENQILETLTY